MWPQDLANNTIRFAATLSFFRRIFILTSFDWEEVFWPLFLCRLLRPNKIVDGEFFLLVPWEKPMQAASFFMKKGKAWNKSLPSISWSTNIWSEECRCYVRRGVRRKILQRQKSCSPMKPYNLFLIDWKCFLLLTNFLSLSFPHMDLLLNTD